MSDWSEDSRPATLGLERDSAADAPWLARGPGNANAFALACQVDELRLLNKRLELANLGLDAHNRHLTRQLDETRRQFEAERDATQTRTLVLEAELQRAWAHAAYWEQRIQCPRYRIADRLNNIASRLPVAHRLARGTLRTSARLARRIKAAIRSRNAVPERVPRTST